MPNAKFDAKSFNPEAFKYIMDRIPRTRLNEIRKSKVLVGNPDIRAVLGTQNGTGYARVAMRGLLDGEAVNYDGQTDITATSPRPLSRAWWSLAVPRRGWKRTFPLTSPAAWTL